MASTNTPDIPTGLNLMENHDVKIITICAVFTFLSLLAIIARLASRSIKHVKFEVDDVLLCTAWIFGAGLSLMIACGTKYARFGWHVWALNKHHLIAFNKSVYASLFLQTTSLVLAKLSVLTLLRRIFITPGFQITVWILVTIIVVGWIIVLFSGAFICFPGEALWNSRVKATCGNQDIMNKVSPIGWILTDLAILICPLPVIKNLNTGSGKRAGLYAIFMIGGLTCIVSIIRCRTLYYPVHDLSWDVVPTTIWTIIEVHVTIICAALIACKPAVTLLFSITPFPSIRSIWSRLRNQLPRKTFGSTSHSRSKNGRPGGGHWSNLNQQPRSAHPSHDITRTSETSSETTDGLNAASTHEVRVKRTFDMRAGDFV